MLLRTLSLVALLQLQLIWVTPFFLEAAAALSALSRPNIALSARWAGINPAPTFIFRQLFVTTVGTGLFILIYSGHHSIKLAPRILFKEHCKYLIS
jgi:hypothetical protein